MPTLSLRARLLALVLVAVVPGFGLILYAAREQQRTLEADAREEVLQLARLVAEQQQRAVDGARGLVIGLARLPGVLAQDAAACGAAVAPLLGRLRPYANLGAVRPDGEMFCSAAPLRRSVNLADRSFVRGAIEARDFAVGGYQVSRVIGVPNVGFGYPALDDRGEVRSVVYASLTLEVLQRDLEGLPLPEEAEAAVTDRWGVVLAAHPDPLDSVGKPFPAGLLQAAARGEEAGEVEGRDGLRRLYALWPVTGTQGETVMRAVVGLRAAEAYAPVRAIFGRTLLLFGLASLLALAAAVVAGERVLVRKLRALAGASRRIAEGDYRVRSGLAAEGGEIGEVVRAFDEMARSLEALQRQNRLLLDSVGEGILGLEGEGRVSFANPAAERLLGREASRMLGRPAHDLIHGTRPDGSPFPHEECPILAALRDGQVHQAIEDTFWRADGSPLPVEYVSTPVRDAGAIVGAVVAFRDVAERRRLEEELRHAQKMEAVGRLAGGVAHDFNNLLTGIVSAAHFLRESLEPAHPGRGDVGEILEAADRAAALTRQLLAFSRRQVLAPRVIDVSASVRSVERMLRRLIGEGVSLEVRLPGKPVSVRADPSQIELVVLNLAVNARDAMPGGGRLAIEVAEVEARDPARPSDPALPAGALVALSVSDSGAGMDEATRARVFEPFFTTKPAGKGTGLGLSTVYGIVTQSGGTVRVQSAPGRGTTFRVYLPRCEPEEAAPEARPAAPARGGTETVLLVEDEDVVRDLARRALAASGYRVLAADGPEAALRLARDEPGPVDLLLTDVILPGSTGPALARRLLELRPAARVLFMSGYTGGQLEEDGVLPAGTAFVQKPFDPDGLLARVREVLDARAAAGRDPAGA